MKKGIGIERSAAGSECRTGFVFRTPNFLTTSPGLTEFDQIGPDLTPFYF